MVGKSHARRIRSMTLRFTNAIPPRVWSFRRSRSLWRLLIDAVCCRTEFDPLRTPHVTRTLAQVYGKWRGVYTKSWGGITSGGGGITAIESAIADRRSLVKVSCRNRKSRRCGSVDDGPFETRKRVVGMLCGIGLRFGVD
jgi:hypothetical protein